MKKSMGQSGEEPYLNTSGITKEIYKYYFYFM